MAPNELLRPVETTAHHQHCASMHSGRLAWERLLTDVGSDGFMITLGFRIHMDRARAVEVANHFLLRVNRRLFGKRFSRHGQSLVGAAVLEHKHHSTRSSHSPHFHFVVSAESFSKFVLSEGRLRSIVEHEAGRLCYPTLNYRQSLGALVSGPDFVDVTKIESPDRLANYLTKGCSEFGSVSEALNIGFFGVNGIQGI